MGLYLAVFSADDDDQELDGIGLGSYADFNAVRTLLSERLDGAGRCGRQFPTFMLHPDPDGVWATSEISRLRQELLVIVAESSRQPASAWPTDWMVQVSEEHGIAPLSLYASLIDVDGAPLLDRLIGLSELAIRIRQPIWFQ